jgi:sugar transferase (PEP-CTERM system associated)
VVIMLAMMSLGLYQLRLRDGGIRLAVRVAISLIVAGVAMIVVHALFPVPLLRDDVMLAALVLALPIVTLSHTVFFQILDLGGLRRRILFYGAGADAAAALSTLRRKTDQRLFELMGCVSLPEEADEIRPETLVEIEQDLHQYVLDHEIDEVVLAMGERRGTFPTQELLACRLSGVEVTNMLSFYERHTGKLKCDLLRPSDIILSDGFRWRSSLEAFKRGFDLLVSSLLLAATLPIIALAGLCIKLEDGLRAPILYRQNRVGLGGRIFRLFKMRSMREDAETGSGARWASRDDDRITRVGAILRKYRIDELPQLFNVVKGDMALVGPRPERPEFVEDLAEKLAFYNVRHRVRPGITGWAQLLYPYGSSDDDALRKLEYDLYYVKNGSLFLDLIILVGTVEVILFGKGAR